MRFALYKEVLKRQRRKKRKLNNGDASGVGGDDDDESDEESDEEDEEVPKRMSAPPVPAKDKDVPQASQDPIWRDDSQDVQMDVEQPPAAAPADDGGIRPERYVVLNLLAI